MMIAALKIVAMIAVSAGAPGALVSLTLPVGSAADITEELPHLYHNALWWTGTHVPSQTAGTGAYCIMKDDGNFAVYDADDRPCFQTGTKGRPGAFLRCQDDGNLVIYTRDKKAIWQSKTYARLVDNPVPERR